MSGINLDTFSDEQVDAMIAGCRALRARREPYVNASAAAAPAPHTPDCRTERPVDNTTPGQERGRAT